MTAPQPATPGSDSVLPWCNLSFCPDQDLRGQHRIESGRCIVVRPAVPSEPPAGACPSALQGSTALIPCSHPAGHPPLDDGIGRYWAHGKGTLHWDRLPVPPAETQQDDETGAGLMRNRCAFTSRDMGHDWPEAFTYAVVAGWDSDDPDEDGAMSEMAAKFGWDEELVEFLRDAHRRFRMLADRAPSEPPAETQQDDEPAWLVSFRQWLAETTQPDSRGAAFAAGWFAARPSADTETLRARIEALESSYRANGEQRDALGKPAWPLNVARDLRTALDAR